MVVKLSELLDRFRPAGAPGTPAATVPQREVVAREETAPIVQLLAEFEAEVDATLTAALAEADSITADADRTARQIRNDLPDRVGVARAEVAEEGERARADAVERISSEAVAQAAAVREAAGFDEIVDRVIALIWDSLPEGRTS
jgi:vacuolar-type H+-ATPase subunit H